MVPRNSTKSKRDRQSEAWPGAPIMHAIVARESVVYVEPRVRGRSVCPFEGTHSIFRGLKNSISGRLYLPR